MIPRTSVLFALLVVGCLDSDPPANDPDESGADDSDGEGGEGVGGEGGGPGGGPGGAGPGGGEGGGGEGGPNEPAVQWSDLGEQVVPAGFTLTLRVTARLEGEALVVQAVSLPDDSAFDAEAGLFTWATDEGDVGGYEAIFRAGGDEVTVQIVVFDPELGEIPDPDPPPADCDDDLLPCADACCDPVMHACIAGRCVELGQGCEEDSDCPDDQQCDPVVASCVDVIPDAPACQFVPPVGEFTPVVACRWTPPADHPGAGRRDVVMAPVVVNLSDDDGDGATTLSDTPDIVFSTYNLNGAGCCSVNAYIRVVSGECGSDGDMRTLATIDAVDVDNSAGLALGDLDGDGVAEIIAILNNGGNPRGLVALERLRPDASEWGVRWTNDDIPRWNRHTRGGGAPALADMNGDGTPDVIVGNAVVDGADGGTLWDGRETAGGGAGIGNNAFLGPASAVADVDLDGEPEVAAGNTLYEADGQPAWTFEYQSSNSRCRGELTCDGFNAIGNFDDDDFGEIVIVRRGEVFILEHTGDLKWQVGIPKDNCEFNESGPPTVADFDGDGRPEIGTAAADFYVVADPDCDADPLPEECDSPGILWKVPNFDCTSRATASSVFDFEGSGTARPCAAKGSRPARRASGATAKAPAPRRRSATAGTTTATGPSTRARTSATQAPPAFAGSAPPPAPPASAPSRTRSAWPSRAAPAGAIPAPSSRRAAGVRYSVLR